MKFNVFLNESEILNNYSKMVTLLLLTVVRAS